MAKLRIGKRLRSLREKFGYTQQQIANALSIDRSTYSYYETGKTSPDLSTLVSLADIFSVSVEELLRPDGETTPFYDSSFHENMADIRDLPPIPFPKASKDISANNSHIYDLSKDEKQLICFYRIMNATQKHDFLLHAFKEISDEKEKEKIKEKQKEK